jgi:RNA polymerase sigma factor (sigma-70 family)
LNTNSVETGKLQDIIKGCIKEDREAQALLFRKYAAKMFALCLYYSKNKKDAEDHLHNGFIKVFQNIKQFKEKGSFEGWMRRIFINMILESFRKMNIRTIEIDNDILGLQTAEEDIISQLNSEEMIRLIQELSPAYRMVFNLYAIEGYMHKEIANMLGISEGTSKSNLSRARGILQKKVKMRFQTSKN